MQFSRLVVGFLLVACTGVDARCQSICDVAKVVRRNDSVEIQLKGSKEYTGLSRGGPTQTDLKITPGNIVANGKKVQLLVGSEGTKFYLAHGMSDSCVLSVEQQDGRLGLYLEEHYHVRGEPPRLTTEFVDAN